MDDPTKFTLFAELKAHAVPWQNRHVRPAITTCCLASVSIKPSTILTSWGKSSWEWLWGGGGKEREVIESHTLCLFIYQFHSNFKELGISPPHLKIFYFQCFLLKCRAEFLSRKKWQRAAALHLKVTKSPGLAEVGLSVWFLQELLWAHIFLCPVQRVAFLGQSQPGRAIVPVAPEQSEHPQTGIQSSPTDLGVGQLLCLCLRGVRLEYKS